VPGITHPLHALALAIALAGNLLLGTSPCDANNYYDWSRYEEVGELGNRSEWPNTSRRMRNSSDRSAGYAREHSSNYYPNEPYGLDPETRKYIETGYDIGRKNQFDRPRPRALPD
jgi:hypothetical protein